MALAEQWYQLAQDENQSALARMMRLRALHWYRQLEQRVPESDRPMIRQRIDELEVWEFPFDPYLFDENYLRGRTWQFGSGNRVRFNQVRFRPRQIVYRQRNRGNPTVKLLEKSGETFIFRPSPATEVELRLMRNGQIEMREFDRQTGNLVSQGFGVVMGNRR